MKKCLAAAIALLICMTCFVTPAFAASLGDVNGDNKITAADARLALRAAVGLEQFTAGTAAFAACDADENGKITAADARSILRAAVGLDILWLGSNSDTSAAGKIVRMIKAYGTYENDMYQLTMENNGYEYIIYYVPKLGSAECFRFYVAYTDNGYLYDAFLGCGVTFDTYYAVAAITDSTSTYGYGEYIVDPAVLSEAAYESAVTEYSFEGSEEYRDDVKALAGGFSVAGLYALRSFLQTYGVDVSLSTDMHLPKI